AERENHLGQARRGHAEVHRRVGRDDLRAADVREDPGLVTRNFSITSTTSRYVAGPSGPKCARKSISALQSYRRAVASAMIGSMPMTRNVSATSSISRARRSPWTTTRPLV